ncbi:MAG: TolC family protein, partial [Longimicrobiales bacterium]
GLGYSLSGSDFYRLSSSRADRRAAGARVEAAAFELEARVTTRYLEALRSEESADVARTQLDRAEENLELVRARFEAGAVPGTDVRQAEVERGRAAVAVVRAENSARVERFRLMEEMGRHTTREIELVDDLEVFDPALDSDALVSRALDAHPRLHSVRETERAGRAQIREAQSSYLPTLSASVGWSGFARELGNTDFLIGRAQSSVESERESCMFHNQISAGLSEPLDGYPQDCSAITLSDSDRAQLLQSNDVFPFDFEKQPLSASLQLSFPIFEGFSRQRRVEEARVQARAAEESRRGEELRLRTEVVTAHGNLDAAWEVVQIEERNRELAQEQLELARERYSLGAAPFLELLDAQNSVAAAERDYLDAVYDFHAARADLERASGIDLTSTGLDSAPDEPPVPTDDRNE